MFLLTYVIFYFNFMLKNILSLSKKLISIKSTAENPKALEAVLKVVLLELKGFTIEKFESNGSKSILIYNSQKRPEKFKILLNGHLDVIPAKDEQYKSKIVGNKLYGAGSMDMKANIACIIAVFKEMASKVDYPLGLQLVTDEEIGGFNGTKYQIEKGVKADFIIAAEPTNFNIVHTAKGVLQVKILSRGVTAHGAYPWKGENAILKMNEFLNILKNNFKNPKKEKWVTTVNVSTIETTNNAFNKIPDDCFVLLDIRYVKEDSRLVLKKLKKLIPKDFKLEIIANEPAMFTKQNNNYIVKLGEITKKIITKKVIIRGANGTSDISHFTKAGYAGIEFGPIGGGIGSDNEWVDISSLDIYCKILKNFLLIISK